jgi:DUF438 domain-containing protein
MGKMGAGMATDCRRITVHTVSLLNRKGSVFYASLSYDANTLKEYKTNGKGDKHYLVTILWDHLLELGNSLWKFHYTQNKEAFPIRVVCNQLGKPYLSGTGYLLQYGWGKDLGRPLWRRT